MACAHETRVRHIAKFIVRAAAALAGFAAAAFYVEAEAAGTIATLAGFGSMAKSSRIGGEDTGVGGGIGARGAADGGLSISITLSI